MPDIVSARPVSGQPVATAWGDEIHDMLEGMQHGQVTGNTASASSAGVFVAVVFPRAYTAAPRILVSNVTGSGVVVGLARNITATGCDVGGARTDGGSAAGFITNWLAIGTLATPG